MWRLCFLDFSFNLSDKREIKSPFLAVSVAEGHWHLVRLIAIQILLEGIRFRNTCNSIDFAPYFFMASESKLIEIIYSFVVCSITTSLKSRIFFVVDEIFLSCHRRILFVLKIVQIWHFSNPGFRFRGSLLRLWNILPFMVQNEILAVNIAFFLPLKAKPNILEEVTSLIASQSVVERTCGNREFTCYFTAFNWF